MFDPNDVVLFCCHIKRNLFFEDSMRRFDQAGFKKIWIIETDRPTFGFYQGPREYYSKTGHFPATYDIGLISFTRAAKENGLQYRYIFLGDFDLYFMELDEFYICMEQIEEEEYDHVSRFKSVHNQQQYEKLNKYQGKAKIAHVQEYKITEDPTGHDWPSPDPHYATGFEFFSQRLWNSFSEYDLGDTRRMMRESYKNGFKMGAHWTHYGTGEKCWGDGWFHVSNLTAYYQMIDRDDIAPLQPQIYHQFRLGHFAMQEYFYGPDIYSSEVHRKLKRFYDHLGGKQACMDAWANETKGTCMERWQKF